MTQFEHTLIASLLTQITWFLFIKRFFYDEDEVKSWQEYFQKKFFS